MNFMSKVVDFMVHYKNWAKAGYPKRSPEWVKELFAICKACEYYQPEGKNPLSQAGFCPPGLCGKCGCHVSDDPAQELNALIYPTKPCPLGKFDAIVTLEDGRNPNNLTKGSNDD